MEFCFSQWIVAFRTGDVTCLCLHFAESLPSSGQPDLIIFYSQYHLCHSNKIHHLCDAKQWCYDNYSRHCTFVECSDAFILVHHSGAVHDAIVSGFPLAPSDHLKSCLDYIKRIHRKASNQTCSTVALKNMVYNIPYINYMYKRSIWLDILIRTK